MIRFYNELDFHLEGPTSEQVVLDRPLDYMFDGLPLAVPAGFVCDLASVPKWLRSIAPPWQQSARAGVIHDEGYRFFCSELVAGGLKISNAIPATVNPSEVTPAELCRWQIYRELIQLKGTPRHISGFNTRSL